MYFITFISNLSPIIGILLVSLATVAFTGCLLGIAHLLLHKRQANTTRVFAQQLGRRIGGLYSLVLALIFSGMAGELVRLNEVAEAEVVAAGNIYWSLKSNEAPEAIQLRSIMPEYLQSVLATDWEFNKDNPYQLPTWKLIQHMKKIIAHWKPSTLYEEIERDYALKNVYSLSDNRDKRIVERIAPNIPIFLWIFCVLGYFLTLTPYLTVKQSKFRVFLILTYAFAIGLIFYGLLAFNNASKFGLVPPTAFEEMLNQMMADR